MAPGEGKRKGSEASSRERFRAPSLPPLPRPGDLTPTQLARLLGERDDLARELASQVRDEGRDLEGVAREHGLPVDRRRLFRRDLPVHLAAALAKAQPGELVGPVGAPEGLALAVIEECRPAELDSATRQRIQDELFGGWLAGRMQQATFEPGILRASG